MLVLAYSRACFAELVLSLDVHSLRRSLVRAGVALGGLPRQWLCDNAKTIVLERQGDAVRFHPLVEVVAEKLVGSPRFLIDNFAVSRRSSATIGKLQACATPFR